MSFLRSSSHPLCCAQVVVLHLKMSGSSSSFTSITWGTSEAHGQGAVRSECGRRCLYQAFRHQGLPINPGLYTLAIGPNKGGSEQGHSQRHFLNPWAEVPLFTVCVPPCHPCRANKSSEQGNWQRHSLDPRAEVPPAVHRLCTSLPPLPCKQQCPAHLRQPSHVMVGFPH